MKRILAAVLILASWAFPALAADNYTATAGTGLTFAAKNISGVLYPWWIPSDSTGAAFGVTGNPFYVSGASGSFVDGWNATEGSKTDTAWVSGSGSIVALLKAIAGSTGPTTWAGTTLGAISNLGTSPGAVAVPSFNAYLVGSSLGYADAQSATGQTWTKIGYNATTSAPTYVSGDSYPPSMTTSGATRQDLFSIGGNAAASTGINGTLAVGGTLAAGSAIAGATYPNLIGGSDGTDIRTMATNSSGQPVVTQAASTPVTGTLQSAATSSTNGSTLSTAGMSAATLTVNCASCSGGTQVNFQGTQDGTNYSAINAVQLGTTTIASSTQTAGITLWEMPVANFSAIRATISGYSAGTVTVTGTTSPVPYNPKVTAANIVSNTTINIDPCAANAGTPGEFDINTATTTRIVAGTGGKKTYFCTFQIGTLSASENVEFVEGANAGSCASPTAALYGGTSSGHGWTWQAGGGLAVGSGQGWVFAANNATGDDVCLITHGTVQVSGAFRYVQQ